MIRIFVAVPVPFDVAQELVALVPAGLGGLKRVAPELLHLTLAFVGWLDERRVSEVVAAVEAAAPGVPAFDVALGGLGRFPPSGRPRAIWVGTGAAAERIEELGERVRAELARRQVPVDPKPLRPHVTLARVRDDAAAADARALAAAVAAGRVPAGLGFRAADVHVMQSVLSRQGPRYSSRASVPLPDG